MHSFKYTCTSPHVVTEISFILLVDDDEEDDDEATQPLKSSQPTDLAKGIVVRSFIILK